MSSKFFNKPNDLEKDKSPLSRAFETKARSDIESKEILTPQEQERFRQEVLEEISSRERPKKRPATVKSVRSAQASAEAKSEILLKIESILEEDLAAVYFKMEPDIQRKFKTKGEESAAKIEKILKKTRVKAKKIFKLIFRWLRIIPGVNKFFIKQEAKIKTDKIIKLK